MARELKYVGARIPLHDAAAKVTGRISYTGDMDFAGMLHVKILFSPYPHAKITRLDTDGAFSVPGVVAVFSHLNSPATTFNSQVWFAGQQAIEDEVLFSETMRYVGDRVAAVVAETEAAAELGVQRLKVEYEQLPVVIAAKDAAPFAEKELSVGSVADGFAAARIVVEDVVETPKVHHAAMEPHVCIAVPDCNGKITVYAPCQILVSVRLIVARVLGLPLNKVRVIKTPLGGSFGGKQEVILEPLCAYMAQATGRPVRVAFDRTASIISTRTRTKTIGRVRTGVDEDGRIVAREVDLLVDTGAYTSNGVVLSIAMGKKLFRLYRIPHQLYRASIVHTNTPVGGACRGYGSPQIHAITEINLDNVARRLNMDPAELRLRNLVRPGDADPSGGPPLGNARVVECVTAGMDAFRWAERRTRPADTGRFRRGVGMACGTHGNGYFGAPYPDFTAMTLRMLEDGSLVLTAGLHELGCGTVTIMKQIIAEVMEIDPERIEAPEGDTETSPFDSGCQASRTTFVCGACALRAAERLRDFLRTEAASVLSCPPEQVMMADGAIWDAETPEKRHTYGDIATLVQWRNERELLVTETYTSQANPGSYGANFAAVEVDTFTGMVRVTDFVAAYDIGRAINPALAEGQVFGGVQMGIGMALCEEITFDAATGRPKQDGFSRYHLINAPDMPPVRVVLIEKCEEYGPFGAKSIGEMATVPTAAAVVNAVNHALGTNLTTLPMTPERVLAAIGR